MRKLRCILLVDDDLATNTWNHFLIEKAACAERIVVASSGVEALYYLSLCMSSSQENPQYPRPDLILLDINMPAINGWEFLEKYKAFPPEVRRDTIVIMLTTSLFPEDLARAKAMPEVATLENKPLTPLILDKILETYF